MNKEQLKVYIDLYNQFQRNPNMQFTNEQINLINEVNKEALSNTELATLLSNTAISTEEERMRALNEYLKEEINQNDEFEQLSEDMKEQIKKYHEYPELLQMLPQEENQMMSYYTNLYEQKLQKEEELQNQQNKPKQKVKIKEETKAGFADVLLLSLITGFLGGVLTTVITILLTK